jgi:hypothetical protein
MKYTIDYIERIVRILISIIAIYHVSSHSIDDKAFSQPNRFSSDMNSDSHSHIEPYPHRHLQSQADDIYANGNGSSSVLEKVNISLARERGYELYDLIYHRWEFNSTRSHLFFLGSANMPARAWDMMKYKVALKIMDNIGKH